MTSPAPEETKPERFTVTPVRTRMLDHEWLCDAVYRAQDASGWAWHVEECSRTGTKSVNRTIC